MSLPHNLQYCARCSIPLFESTSNNSNNVNSTNAKLCGECITKAPAFDRCITPLRYEFPINRLINRFKHQGDFCYGKVLADLLIAQINTSQYSLAQEEDSEAKTISFNDISLNEMSPNETSPNKICLNDKPDLIVPVPLHWRRRFVRGFNQSQWLASYLSRQYKIATDNKLLVRIRNSPPQQSLQRIQRHRNLKGAFQVTRTIEGLDIVLVDDVVTTGSTVAELSKILKKAGAAKVHVWCLARTPLEK